MKKITTLWAAAVALALGAGLAVPASAAGYPDKAIRMVVPFPAGGGTDALARILGKQMSAQLGQPIVVDNKVGANGIIGADIVAKAKPDGYTLMVSIDSTWAMNQHLYASMPHDPLTAFAPVAKVATIPIFLIASHKGPKTLDELVQRAKKEPGAVTFAYGSTMGQLAGEILQRTLQIDLRPIAYKGSAGNLQGLLSDDVDMALDVIVAARPHVQAGRLAVLATMSKTVLPGMESVEPVAGPKGSADVDVSFWVGVSAPHGTPPDVVDKLVAAIRTAAKSPEYLETLSNNGLVSDLVFKEDFQRFMQDESRRWGKEIKEAGIKVQ